jgi:coenzyme F420 biosynthesis associated uncharacterized protein
MAASSNSSQRQNPAIDRRLVAAGLVAGAAVGAWASTKLRSKSEANAPAGVIDWEHARIIAINMNRGRSLTAVERERLDTYYNDLVQRCIPIVSDYMGATLPNGFVKTYAFDRVDWINANLEAFRTMFAPIESLASSDGNGRSIAAELWGSMNRTVISTEVGLLLGYLARRVLGQYDLALMGREPVTSGKLYYVEPNITFIETSLGLPREEFRLWLALHETTHAFEFEAYPWVRSHFNKLLERYFEYFKQDIDQLRHGMKAVKIYVDRMRTRDKSNGTWIESLMVPEQRALFNEMQAMMCIVEGYSNHVMNAVGKTLMPSYEGIANKFEQRRTGRGMAEQLFAKLTGLDMKMEQYRLGELFINTIAEQRGLDAVKKIWEGPLNLPTMTEIRQPEQWVERVLNTSTIPAPAAPAIVAPAELTTNSSDGTGPVA